MKKMTERYLITGVQLGMFIAGNKELKEKLVDHIIDSQYIGDSNYYVDKDADNMLKYSQEIKDLIKINNTK